MYSYSRATTVIQTASQSPQQPLNINDYFLEQRGTNKRQIPPITAGEWEATTKPTLISNVLYSKTILAPEVGTVDLRGEN